VAIPESFIDELLGRTDIVDIVSVYVPLKRKGSNHFGLCPFHGEKTASFSVNQDKQIYHCFGCGAGGGVVSFIMQIEGLSFPDAIRFLAEKAGMSVPEEDLSKTQRLRRDRVLSLNREAARFFYDRLSQPESAAAAEYVRRRGLSSATVKRFGIGFAPDSWDELIRAMTEKGYEKGELLDAGLVVKNKSGGLYDRFRNRLMFPIINVRGEVVGFGGRVLDDSLPKYLNSPDTLVFNKNRNLFALNIAKKTKQGRLILAEGYMDVVSLHQAGFDCAVASLGTSLTEQQAVLMSRYAKQVVIAYDSDQAGVAASQRAISILDKTGMEVKVLRYAGAKDPDEFIRSRGRDAFENLLNGSENHIAYRLGAVQAKYDLSVDEQRVEYVKEAAVLLARLNPAEREVYGARAAEAAAISPEAMAIEVKRAFARLKKQKEAGEQRKLASPLRMAQPAQRGLRYENTVSALAEEGLLTLLFSEPEYIPEASAHLTEPDFSSSLLGRLFSQLEQRHRESRSLSLSAMTESFSPEEFSYITGFMHKPLDKAKSGYALRDYIAIIRREREKSLALENDEKMMDLYRKKKAQSNKF